ncbi:YqgE/AlgH family protein [Nocardiopsis sp. LOL_012]|uniref:YqgE/AlgH family protein n=1 Tax=Nocardiopsis sp. LOL_012 TaxID=3345409 RepID=UPI003A85AC79
MDRTTLTGSLLVAAPMLREDSFRRSVVFVVDDTADGTLGVILNRPSDAAVGAVVAEWGGRASEPAVVFSGGPVGTGSGIALGAAALDGRPEGWSPLEGLGPRSGLESVGMVDLGRTPDTADASLTALRVFDGYAGWSSGQLAGEIEEGAWFVVSATADDVFTAAPEGLWGRVLRRQGGTLALLSTYPDDPELN